jgi:hypothetical protein
VRQICAIPGREIVDDPHLVAERQQAVDDV